MNNGYSICLNEWALDKSIKTELGLLLIISGLTASEGYCYAKNEYFSKLFNVDEVTISRRIKKLVSKGYIYVKYNRNGNVVVSREIRLTKVLTAVNKNAGAVNKTVKDNNTITNNRITIINREAEFKNSLQPFLETYGKDMLNDFYLYWTEKKPKGRKMLFEMQKTFDVSRRLARWNKNNFNNKNLKAENNEQLKTLTKSIREQYPDL